MQEQWLTLLNDYPNVRRAYRHGVFKVALKQEAHIIAAIARLRQGTATKERMKRAKDVLVANNLWEMGQKQQSAGKASLVKPALEPPGWTTGDYELYKEFLLYKVETGNSENFAAWCSRKRKTASAYFRSRALETLKSEYLVLTKCTEDDVPTSIGSFELDPNRKEVSAAAPAWAQALLKEATTSKVDIKEMKGDMQALRSDVHKIVLALTALRKSQ